MVAILLGLACVLCPAALLAGGVELPTPGIDSVSDSPAGDALAESVADGRYADAVAAARTVLDSARADAGSDGPPPIGALLNLAAAQARAGEPIDAIATYERASALLRANGGNRNPRLVRPLLGIGTAAFKLGDYRRAVTAFVRASFISRVRGGPDNREQLRGYDGLIAAYVALGRYAAAARYQRKRLAVIARAAGRKSSDYAGALLQTASWFSSIGWYREARALYREQLQRLRENDAGDQLARARLLAKIGLTYAGAGKPSLIARAALRDALAMQQEAEAARPKAIAKTYLALGDFYLAFGAVREAERRYMRAYKILKKADATQLLQDLDHPESIFWRRVPANVEPLLNATADAVRLSLSVGRHGRVSEVKVLGPSSLGPGLQRRAIDAVESAVFRPRITEQGIARTDDVIYRYRWAR